MKSLVFLSEDSHVEGVGGGEHDSDTLSNTNDATSQNAKTPAASAEESPHEEQQQKVRCPL